MLRKREMPSVRWYGAVVAAVLVVVLSGALSGLASGTSSNTRIPERAGVAGFPLPLARARFYCLLPTRIVCYMFTQSRV